MWAPPAGIGLALIAQTRSTGTWRVEAAVLGALNIGGFFALLFYAAVRLPGGVASTLGTVQPLITGGFVWLATVGTAIARSSTT
jgi:probable blue pigment (indigoidine) exporter